MRHGFDSDRASRGDIVVAASKVSFTAHMAPMISNKAGFGKRTEMVRFWRQVCAAAILSWTPASVAAQNSQVEWRQSCAECRLTTRTILRISAEAEPPAPMNAVWTAARDLSGRYWVSFANEDVPRVFSAEGVPISSVGRIGEGPGEFRSVLAIIPVGDSVLLFDQELRRMSVVDREFRTIRSVRLQGQVFSGVALDWPRVAINGVVSSTPGQGHPFHILNIQTGEVEHSFGGSPHSTPSPQDLDSMLGWIATDAATGDIWSAMRTQFRIQRWDKRGRHIKTFTGLDSWFPPEGRGRQGSPSRKPDGVVNALIVGPDGILHVVLQAPARNWRSAWPKGSTSSAGHPSPGQGPDRALLYDSYIAALDPSAGTILTIGSVAYDAMSNAQVQSAFIALLGLEDLYPTLAVVEVTLKQRPH
jgi:hypothetical protein